MTPDQYHADFSRDSNSSISLFAGSIPRYAAERVYRTLPPREPTPAMVFGDAFDTFLLTPDDFADRFAVAPEVDRRTKDGKAAWADFLERANGKRLIEAETVAIIQAMREAALADPTARRLLEAQGQAQRVIQWTHASGRPLKMRADKIMSNGLIVDVKTAASVSPNDLARSAANFGYQRQAALYLEGAWTQGIEGPFVFLVVCKEPPHEVVVYTLDDAALELGRKENQRLIDELHGRHLSGDWSSRWGGIQIISLPKYAFFERQEQ